MKRGAKVKEGVNMRRALLICGIVATLLYIGADVYTSLIAEGYSYTDQTISELSAVGASTRPFLAVTGTLYLILVVLSGIGILLSAGKNQTLHVVGILIIIYGIVGFIWPFAPMHQREVLAAGGGTFSDTMHLIMSAVDSILFFLIIGFGAAALGKKFRIYSIVMIMAMLVFGGLTGLGAPKVAVNDPTPWLGIIERINVLGAMIWMAVLGIVLLRLENKQNTLKHVKNN